MKNDNQEWLLNWGVEQALADLCVLTHVDSLCVWLVYCMCVCRFYAVDTIAQTLFFVRCLEISFRPFLDSHLFRLDCETSNLTQVPWPFNPEWHWYKTQRQLISQTRIIRLIRLVYKIDGLSGELICQLYQALLATEAVFASLSWAWSER